MEDKILFLNLINDLAADGLTTPGTTVLIFKDFPEYSDLSTCED